MDYQKLIEIRKIITERIEEIIHDGSFKLSIEYLKEIHRFLFEGIIDEAGNFRTYNVRKAEIILFDDSVIYPDYHTIETYLNYDINEEKKINYQSLKQTEQIKKIADFTSRIWMTHPFCEGNTRTTSVFVEKHLQSIGYDVDNSKFKSYSGFFRDALVKSCYYNESLGIHMDQKPLIHFFHKVLLDTNEELSDNELEIPELYRGRRRILTNQNNNKKK